MTKNPSKKRREWQQIMADHQKSGQSVANYCATKNISPKNFSKWQYLFKRETKPTELDSPKSFVCIKTNSPTVALQNETISCHLPNGLRIEWPASVNASSLLPLLRGLA